MVDGHIGCHVSWGPLWQWSLGSSVYDNMEVVHGVLVHMEVVHGVQFITC